ncbi:macro domain-containing protein [Pseudogracilibacillus auburnensis]|uniref:macro domain-containing protein n=1 Tax=Pseudogracilibacillus auburnensis TaxID=1494959 RepID=UPI001A95AD8E|nr:macro domain-containing protein [Pseudogracilibacillus auburnensis]MBO1001813.1 hypothetical protein [Pseudogracilibacillus auburnensis]
MKKVRELVVSKRFWKEAFLLPGCLFSLATIVLTFLDGVGFVREHKVTLFVIVLLVSFLWVVNFFVRKVYARSVRLTINQSVVEVMVGDIFTQPMSDFKAIPFNEFFDTLVDGKVVSRYSLHGKYLLGKYPDGLSLEKLDGRMAADEGLHGNVVGSRERWVEGGKRVYYRLGSVFKDGDYFLVAFSKMNDRGEAGVSLTEYVQCLLTFWEEADRYRQGQTVVVPLFGTGITRYRNFYGTPQELVEIIIWTFEMSRVDYKTPAKVRIVIHEELRKEINFFRLKELEK